MEDLTGSSSSSSFFLSKLSPVYAYDQDIGKCMHIDKSSDPRSTSATCGVAQLDLVKARLDLAKPFKNIDFQTEADFACYCIEANNSKS
jgi:hypothetical protein